MVIINAIVAMAANLKLGVIAEGVETQEQVDILNASGCRAMQGYYFARPMAAEFFGELLAKGTTRK
jgi:EAL domain-containing protein (putative c-di-GMP-specific phosphodiesterase class I)